MSEEQANTSTTPPPNFITITPPPYPTYKNHHHNITDTIRDYRKGNWTPEETLILITAKKLDDERRITTTTSNTRTGGELRWKWVENYCWSNGCLRSQNQCNDKWDNLLRDYKKVREYLMQQQSSSGGHNNINNINQNRVSYWAMDKIQRKQRNLPSGMSLNIYEALDDVVQRKHFPHKQQQTLNVIQPAPPPTVLPPPEVVSLPPTGSEASTESQGGDGEDAEKADNETKRRRVRDDIGSTIINSTELLSQTLKHHDDNKQKRHNQLMELEQQRIHLEETRTQVNRQGIAALITSINKLSEAIHALISEKRP